MFTWGKSSEQGSVGGQGPLGRSISPGENKGFGEELPHCGQSFEKTLLRHHVGAQRIKNDKGDMRLDRVFHLPLP